MTTAVARLRERQAWNTLTAHHAHVRELHLRKLIADDPARGERMSLEAAGLNLIGKDRQMFSQRGNPTPP